MLLRLLQNASTPPRPHSLLPLTVCLLGIWCTACLPSAPRPIDDQDGDSYSVLEDCDDFDAVVGPAYVDLDMDGHGRGDPLAGCGHADQPGTSALGDDCDDTSPDRYPGAVESCNGIDDDCNGLPDDGLEVTFYADDDGDGHGDALSPMPACEARDGFVSSDDDCDDTESTVYDGAVELCDALDNDCDGSVDENLTQSPWYEDVDQDGHGAGSAETACAQPDGYSSRGDDCQDDNANVHPEAPEICDGLDDDCDRQTDEELELLTWYEDGDGDGFGDDATAATGCAAPEESASVGGDCDDSRPDVNPGATEVCDDTDNDCDGSSQGIIELYYRDADGDGYGAADGVGLEACGLPLGYRVDHTDCDDSAAVTYPEASERCDGHDNDCDGAVDDGLTFTDYWPDEDGDGFGDQAAAVRRACSPPGGFVTDDRDCDDEEDSTYPGAREQTLDGIDSNCNGIEDGEALIVAGRHPGKGGDGGPGTEAQLYYPSRVTWAAGQLYIADTYNSRVVRVDAQGIFHLVAGTGVRSSSGDGGQATLAQVNLPLGVAVDGLGNIFIAEGASGNVRKVSNSGIISTFAGCHKSVCAESGQALETTLSFPVGLAAAADGSILVGDQGLHRVLRIDTSGNVSTFAGNGNARPANDTGSGGDGGPATSAVVTDPEFLAFDSAGNLYLSDTQEDRVRRVDVTGTINTVYRGSSTGVSGVAVNSSGTLFVSSLYRRSVYQVDSPTLAHAIAGSDNYSGFYGDGGPATSALLDTPQGLTIDGSGNLFLTDSRNHRIRRIASDGTIETVVGSAGPGFAGDGGAATLGLMNTPEGLAVGTDGSLYIADKYNHAIRRVGNGLISTVAGTGAPALTTSSGDGGPATNAQLTYPSAVAQDAKGNLYIADTVNYVIRKVGLDGNIIRFAGNGESGYSGDGGVATKARLGACYSIALDPQGRLLIADSSNNRIRRVDINGMINTIAGNGKTLYPGDGALGTEIGISAPTGLTVHPISGDIYFSDLGNNAVRHMYSNGYVSTMLKGGVDSIFHVQGMSVDGLGDFYLVDEDGLKRYSAEGVLETVIEDAPSYEYLDAPFEKLRFTLSYGVVVAPDGSIFFSDRVNQVMLRVRL